MPPTDLPCPDRRTALAGAFALALSLGLAVPARAQEPFDLVRLMQTLAQVKAGEATFVERRSVAMLERTLESSGRLSFEAPDTFVRETLKPRREKVVVSGNNVTMSLGSRSRTVPLDSVPEAAVIMEAVRGTLTGNRDAIERNFAPTVSGTPQRWSLELKPREPRLRELVIAVRVAGERALVREVTVAMADGDRSVMTIEPAVPGTKTIEPAAPGAKTPEPAAASSPPASAAR
jgi:outer membrane lipoprotein-sorting protein